MGIHARNVSIILFFYGVAIAIGNALGGRFGDRKPLKALLSMFFVQAVILLTFTFTAPSKAAGLITVLAMGLLAFMSVPVLQSYVLTLAHRYVPSAIDVASSLNIASFNGGIALGSYIGGLTTSFLGLQHTPWVASAMVLLGALLTVITIGLEKKEK